MDIWIAFIVGVIIGGIVVVIKAKSDLCGCLRIDQSDKNNKPYLFLELSKDVNDIYNKEYVIFKVYKKDFIPHK